MAYDGQTINDLDPNKPDGSVEYGNILDDAIREIKRCIKNSAVEQITFPYGNSSEAPQLAAGAIYLDTERHAILSSIDGVHNEIATTWIEPGTKMLFAQNNVPYRWTFVDTWHDRTIMITSNLNQGGYESGSWVITGLTNDWEPEHGHLIPPHDTTYATNIPIPNWRQVVYAVNDDNSGWSSEHHLRVDEGGCTEGQHCHYIEEWHTANNGGHTHTIRSDGNWRPAFLGVICCRKI
jgi:hypothetical protein